MLHLVHRVALFHGWTDAKHGWVALGATPSNRYYSLLHARENIFDRTCYGYLALGMTPSCPLTGFTVPPAVVDPANPVLIDNRKPPFGTRLLVHNLEPFTTRRRRRSVPHEHHPGRVDPERGRRLTPSRILLNGWRSTLGDSDADTFLDQADNCALVANADQTDSDQQRHRRRVRPDVRDGHGRRHGAGDARAHARHPGDVRRVRARRRPAPTTRARPRT